MRLVTLIIAMAFVAIIALSSTAFAQKPSCESYCVGYCQKVSPGSTTCGPKCIKSCYQNRAGH
jgi:hypothetical protein